MIQATMQLVDNQVTVEVEGNNLMFHDIESGTLAPLEGIKLSEQGVKKQFPDLENDEEWHKKAIERVKKHMKEYQTEREKIKYVVTELQKNGYELLYFRRKGWRPSKRL